MGEARLLIQSFIGKGAQAAEESGQSAAAGVTPPPDTGNVDTSAVSKETEQVKKEQKQKRPALKVIQGGAKGLQESVPTVSDFPTPGGIGLLLFIVLFLLFAITKTNGSTRLQLMWSALLGRAGWTSGGAVTPGISADPANTDWSSVPGDPYASYNQSTGSWSVTPGL